LTEFSYYFAFFKSSFSDWFPIRFNDNTEVAYFLLDYPVYLEGLESYPETWKKSAALKLSPEIRKSFCTGIQGVVLVAVAVGGVIRPIS